MGRTDVLYIAELPPGADFSVLGAHLIPDHVSRFDPKVPHFSVYFPPVHRARRDAVARSDVLKSHVVPFVIEHPILRFIPYRFTFRAHTSQERPALDEPRDQI